MNFENENNYRSIFFNKCFLPELSLLIYVCTHIQKIYHFLCLNGFYCAFFCFDPSFIQRPSGRNSFDSILNSDHLKIGLSYLPRVPDGILPVGIFKCNFYIKKKPVKAW